MEDATMTQIKLPSPDDTDPHPRLLVNGRGIHAGEVFTVWLPGGWCDVRLEVDWDTEGPGCWYIASPSGMADVCPIGLFVKD